MGKLNDKVAIITGGSTGIGKGIADVFASEGCSIVIGSRDGKRLEQSADELRRHGSEIICQITDVTSEFDVKRLFKTAMDRFGKIDILVNNAKANFGKRFEEVTESEFDTLMDFNLKSMFLTCQSVGQTMLKNKRGRIINMTSDLAVRGLWNSVVPCASEGAIHQLTSSLALEWGRDGIRVNGIGQGGLAPNRKQTPVNLIY